jgi:subtilisin family serine protease
LAVKTPSTLRNYVPGLALAVVATLSVAAHIPCAAASQDAQIASAPVRRRAAGRLLLRQRAGLSRQALQRVLRRNGAVAVRSLEHLGVAIVHVPEADLQQVEQSLRRSGLFKAVERDYVVHIAETPDDPHFASQWALPKIAAPLSWDLSKGSPNAPVAVLDTGVELAHPDLAGQLLPGFDFVNGDTDPSDDHGHGTRMIGIVAARQNNALGVSGIAPDSQILPGKVMGSDGTGLYGDVADGITWAVDQGARVINLSLVGTAPSSVLQSAIDYATANGVITVASSGNWGTDDPAYPAAFDDVVSVGATGDNDVRSSFSNYGASLDVMAPGASILTTTLNAGYTGSTGTSPAAAHASATLALLLAAEPGIGRTAAIQRLYDGAADLGDSGWDLYHGWGRIDAYAVLVPGAIGSPGPDPHDPTSEIVSPSQNSLVWGMVPVDVAATDNVAIAHVDLYVDNSLYASETIAPYSFVIDATEMSAGTHKLQAFAYDTNGNSAKSKKLQVSFTPGVGLLVNRAKVRSTSASISARLALPEGVEFDPTVDDVSVTLSTASGAVFAATAQTADIATTASGRAKATVVADVPSSGNVRMVLKPVSPESTYKLRLSASQLSSMSGADTTMDLTVQVGTTILSQSLTFREKKSKLLYP